MKSSQYPRLNVIFLGEKWWRSGWTSSTNKSAETSVVERDALVEMTMRFIWENPRSHSLEEIGTAFKAFFKSTKFSGNIFWFKWSRNQLLLDNCDLAKITATIQRTRERMFSLRVVSELPDYRSDRPQVIYKERRGDFLMAHSVLLGFGILLTSRSWR
jgi:hypothetical protein